jgi:hypothetical protein
VISYQKHQKNNVMINSVMRVKIKNLRNELHVGFHQKFAELVYKFGADNLGIAALFESHKVLLAEEESVLDVIKKSVLTSTILKQDKIRSNYYRGFVDVVKANLTHFEPARSEAASNLQVVLDNYGNIPGRPVDLKTVAIRDFLDELSAKPQPATADGQAVANEKTWNNDVLTLGVSEWLTKIEDSNNLYHELMSRRNEEMAMRSPLRMVSARRKSDIALIQIFDLLDALVLVNGREPYDAFLLEWNAYAKRLRDLMAQSVGRRAASAQAQATKTEQPVVE